jgi:Amt family ammonium transporter
MNSGDTSFVLSSSALVMFMTPGLGFFYGGMVSKKNMLSTIGYCFIVFSLVSVLWALLGFSLVFAPTSN